MTKNQETIDEILRLRDSGMKVQEIADHYGVSKERVYQIAGNELKAWQAQKDAEKPPKKKRKLDIRTIRKQMAQGKTVAEIADMYGVSKGVIYSRVKEDEAMKMSLDNSKNLLSTIGGKQGVERLVDPESGMLVEKNGKNAVVIGRMGDEKVTAFVNYHMEMLAMRQGVDKTDVNELYNRFIRYLSYCEQHGVVPGNMNCYFAIGINRQDISKWKAGGGTPEHKQFAEDVTAFFASVHEQGGTDGVLNPISAMFWQKAHDGLIEASKLEVVTEDPLGEKRSAEQIAKAYTDVELPD